MKRIAIVGGGISGLAAAYELELARKHGAAIDWHLYEASDRLGGIVQTTRIGTPEGEYILEGGPDAWVSEKPWARELAIELGLGEELIYSNDATRRTWVERNGRLLAIPANMRLMVPNGIAALAALDDSPLFSAEAKAAYAAEIGRAEELRATALDRPGNAHADESVARFVLRHFGEEVLTTLAAPLLSGIFGGDVHKLSVRAVIKHFVDLERDHGSLILGLDAKRAQRAPDTMDAPSVRDPSRASGDQPPGGNQPGGHQPIFTSLKRGMASLVEAIVATLPADRVHLSLKVEHLSDDPRWQLILDDADFRPEEKPHPFVVEAFDHVFIATPLDVTKPVLATVDYDLRLDKFLPTNASSAILATLTWPADIAGTFNIPAGFGFLVPPASTRPPVPGNAELTRDDAGAPPLTSATWAATDFSTPGATGTPSLLACTFVDQKFPHRAPPGARVLRAFFGGDSATALANATDAAVVAASLAQLSSLLGFTLPTPEHTVVSRWPRSLPQYEVGHLDRIAELDALVAQLPGLTLLGNSYCGVGLPDLIHAARTAARAAVPTPVTN
jgi:oxygen-dependent protoporphyrinogen oxidase